MAEVVKDEHVVICDCGDIEHNAVLTATDYGDEDGTFLYLHVKMDDIPWHKRVVQAFKYVFGMNRDYDYVDIVMNKDNTQKLIDFLEKHKKGLRL
jgi:hypothetical protein